MHMRISMLLLASSMALVQAGSNPGQSQNAQSGQPGAGALNPIQQTLRGCLRQSGDSWTLSQSSQETTLSGDASLLRSHDGQQVEVQGTQPIGGTLQVTSVITISSSCIGQSSSKKTVPSADSTSKTVNQPATKGQSSTSSKPEEPTSPPAASGQTPSPSQTQAPPAKPPLTR